jgi:hypothetical protein
MRLGLKEAVLVWTRNSALLVPEGHHTSDYRKCSGSQECQVDDTEHSYVGEARAMSLCIGLTLWILETREAVAVQNSGNSRRKMKYWYFGTSAGVLKDVGQAFSGSRSFSRS